MEGNSVVRETLDEENYKEWSTRVKTYLLGHDLWEIVEANESDAINDNEKSSDCNLDEAWSKKKNALALHVIHMALESEAFSVIKDISSAKLAWAALEAEYGDKSESSKPEFDSVLAKEYEPLFKAVYRGNWDSAERFLEQHPEVVRARAPCSGKTPLHVAVSEEHLYIVEKLVEKMTEQDLEMKTEGDFTALAIAIEIGSISIARCLIRRHKKLASITTEEFGLPVQQAVIYGKYKMVQYLYISTPLEDLTTLDNGVHGAKLMSYCIHAKFFDIALHLMERASRLAITEDGPGRSPIFSLACVNGLYSNHMLRYWQRWIYHCVCVPDSATDHISLEIHNLEDEQMGTDKIAGKGSIVSSQFSKGLLDPLQWVISSLLKFSVVKRMYKMKKFHNQTRKLLDKMCEAIEQCSDGTQLKKAGVGSAIVQAIYTGDAVFIKKVAKANPNLLWNCDLSRALFRKAVAHRNANTFSLIYGLRDKVTLASYQDENSSCMLHEVASIAPSRLLNRIPGPALQMQKELQWFKAVEKIANPLAREARNKDYLQPREIFTESHKDLVDAGEKWMKDTSSSCTVVCALIVTVTFAAAFTVPGGNNQENGLPFFLNKKLFNIFMISDAIALFSSITSLLMFLGILTSRYAEEDFLRSLPTKLIIGLSTLFLSMAGMIIAFCAGLSIMFREDLWVVGPSVCLASIPVGLFVWMQFPLLIDIFMSTYGPSMFDKNVKRWI